MRARRSVIGIVMALLIGVLVLGMVGCGEKDSTAPETSAGVPETSAGAASETETSVAAGAFDGEIVIGALGTMTGPGAMGGAEQMWAQQKAADDINAKGGVNLNGKKMQLKIKFMDDQSDANQGAAAIEKLIKVEGTKLILSTQVTPVNMAAAIVAEKYGAVYQMVVTWTSFAREQKYQWCPDLFFSPEGVAMVPFEMLAIQPEAERPTTVGVITHDDVDGRALADGVVAIAESKGYKVGAYEAYQVGTKDFSSSILKLKQGGVDALFCVFSPADGITFTKQMKEQNFSPKFMFGWKGYWPTEYMQALKEDSNYVGFDGFWSEDLPFPGAKELGEAYRNAHNGLDSVSIGLPYAAVQVLATAIERAGSTEPGPVRDEIYGGSFPGTAIGDVVYDDGGVADIPALGLQWVEGKRVVIAPEEMATGKLQWFVPWLER
jgi:branched-chain amino acid transport system substrate-binding protein